MPHAVASDELKVIGRLPLVEAAAKLREMDDPETADVIERAHAEAPSAAPNFGLFGELGRPRAYQHTAHTIGFLPSSPPGGSRLPIRYAGNIEADESLKNSRLRITLNRLRIADYPGRGMHRVLFDFYARNQLLDQVEEVHFNSTFRVQEGQAAAVVGYPIFNGLNVGVDGVAFRCFTVNVKNDVDEAFLDLLESDVVNGGLELATVAQPSLRPFVKIAHGLTIAIGKRNRNVPVQDIYLGLDFGGTTMGARLALGDYIAVQIPEDLVVGWDWNEWVYDPGNGQIVLKADPTRLIPYNYLVFGIGRHRG
jgi:hypothetical protein